MKNIWVITVLFFLGLLGIWSLLLFISDIDTGDTVMPAMEKYDKGITPSKNHEQYWSYAGQDIMLLGGSVEDNLFQIPNLEEHLDLLADCGGNYVRNTMSSRDSGNTWAFQRKDDGLYDLNHWNSEYWRRFSRFLQASGERDIIVQIELWATFDFYRDNWEVNPFNPKNNVNYTTERTGLPIAVPTHPVYTDNNFFWSVPRLEHNIALLRYQQKYIDKLLSYTLLHDHVLYCMDNETSVTSEWGRFWSDYIRKKAREAGKEINTTEMWDPWDLDHLTHRETFDHPETYSFVDISQNNHNEGDTHWNNGLRQIERLRNIGVLRPVNNVKIYGNDGGRHQTTRNGIECFVRNVLMGAASARFHRPTSGQGLNATARAVISSMRSYVNKVTFFDASPANTLLRDREANEAYCRAAQDKHYAVYFPDGGSVQLDLVDTRNDFAIEWLDIMNSKWTEASDYTGGGWRQLDCPDKGHWLALITKK
jgi:hypothetical protein